MRKSSKVLAVVLACALAVGGAIGGTMAWLSDKTAAVKNVFTYGNVGITLTETTDDFHIVPGRVIAKDPKVTVAADSEDCYVFVKVEQKDWSEKFTYTMAAGWNALNGVDGVYYCEAEKSQSDRFLPVLLNDQVKVLDTLTKADIDAAVEKNQNPTLTFTAYAIQKEGFENAADAWKEVGPGKNA